MSTIDEVKSRLDIVDVVSDYVDLKRSGRNYKALCPFHSEKTASFVVFPDSQRWHCFGACNEGGDVFSFLMKHEGYDFRTALEELAKRAGIELRPPTPAQAEAAEEADRLRDILGAAARYYHNLLLNAPEAEAARRYVDQRNLNEETVKRFELGYSLPGWENTRHYLTKQGYEVEDLLKAGLVAERDSGGTYDRFRERLMIPIRDVRGRVIGFGARTLDPEGVPKYLNSPKTPLFDKSETIFGLNLARRAIRSEDRVIIAEGYMDVMQAHQVGFKNVVAQMGTALTEPQLNQLQRYTQRITLALDPDAAGVQATLRGVEVASEALEQEWTPVFNPRGLVGYESQLGVEMRVLQLPQGQDPDDLIREDPKRWTTLVEEASPVVDFYLQILMEEIDLEDTKAKARVVDKLLPVLRAVTNPVEREDYAQKIARALRLDERAVMARLRSKREARRSARRPPRAPAEPQDESTSEQETIDGELERYCLAMLLQYPRLLHKVDEALVTSHLEPLQAQDFHIVSYRSIFAAWKRLLVTDPSTANKHTLRQEIPSDLQPRLEKLLTDDKVDLADEYLIRDVVRTLLRLRQRRLKRLVQDLKLLQIEAHEEGDPRAKQYDQAQITHTQVLLRTQRALAQEYQMG
jgi:DNA primase